MARHQGVLLCKTDFEVGLNKTLTKLYAFQGDILVDNFADSSLWREIDHKTWYERERLRSHKRDKIESTSECDGSTRVGSNRLGWYSYFLTKMFTGGNFMNLFCTKVFWAAFLRLWNFFGKRILSQKLFVKCWWNWLQVACSSTFYLRLFVLHRFSLLTFCFWVLTRFPFAQKLQNQTVIE